MKQILCFESRAKNQEQGNQYYYLTEHVNKNKKNIFRTKVTFYLS